MTARSRRRPPRPAAGKRRTVQASSRRSHGWLLGAVIAVVAAVVVIAAVLVSSRGGALPGLQTGPPPWLPETVHLRDRLSAIGLSALTAEGQVQHTHQHLDLFVDGQAVQVPAGIGINAAAGFLSPIHTHDATGIIHVESPVIRDFTLGEFFDVWGVRFDSHCVGGDCDGSGRSLSVFVNGQSSAGDPRSIVLVAHQEIVVSISSAAQLPNPIPSTYTFPAGL